MTEKRSVSTERVIPASPAEVFDLLTDPAQHVVFDGSNMVQGPRSARPERLRLGSRFGMDMRMGPLPYRITNTVVEFEANRRIAWHHYGRHRWRWELEPAEAGTRVRETFDWSTARVPPFIEMMGYPQRNLEAMERSLERLARHFEQGTEHTTS